MTNSVIRDVLKLCTGSQTEIKSLPHPKTAILLANVGTTHSYKLWDLRSYLREFLSDRRIIEMPRFIWYPILYCYILIFRPYHLIEHYKTIWNKEEDESPLVTYTKNQAKELQQRLGDGVIVEWAFRYGPPSIPSKIESLQKQGCNRLIFVPLYPQYSATTTATVCDEAFATLHKQRHQMSIKVIQEYYKNPIFLDAISSQTRKFLKAYDSIEFDVVLVSYHGIPLRYQEKGDPYGYQCHETTRLLKDSMKDFLPDIDFITCFASRFGHSEWLKPYTEDLTLEFARNGVKNILLLTPGFSSDCLETLYELDIELEENFKEHGGENFVRVPCLNDSKEGIDVLEAIIKKELH